MDSSKKSQTTKEIFEKAIEELNSENYQEAIKYFTRVIDVEPNNSEAYNQRGVPIQEVAYMLGHESIQTTKKYYTEVLADNLREKINTIS